PPRFSSARGPPASPPLPYTLLFRSLRPHLQAMADRLAGHGYAVLVPNVFYRAGRTPVFDLPEFIDPQARPEIFERIGPVMQALTDRKSTRLNSSHVKISYAVFCLKK